MSSTKKMRRLLLLLERLQSGRRYTSAQLMSLCQVSRRTVFRDIKMLQDAGVEILYDSATLGYWLPVQSLLPATHLNLAETIALLLLAQEAGRTGHAIPFQESARDAALKLQGALPAHISKSVAQMSASMAIETEPLAELTGQRQHYDRILDAVSRQRKVRAEYQSFAEQKVIHTLISPYKLLFRRHTWYVIGRSSIHRAVRTFHLGRFRKTVTTSERFEIPPRFSLKSYFGKAWSLIRERTARSEILIRFQPLVASNVAEIIWHPFQKLSWNDDGTLDFRVSVDGINEISWWILGYGNQAEVLELDNLRDLIKARIGAMYEIYT